MNAQEARDMFSQYVDGTLDSESAKQLCESMNDNPALAEDFSEFEQSISVLHRTPLVEPMIDMWQAIQPHMAEYAVVKRLSVGARLRRQWLRAMAQFSSGIIIYTQSIAAHTHARFERYLLSDPFPTAHQKSGE